MRAILFIFLLSTGALSSCSGAQITETNSFTWTTAGEFEISCSATQLGFAKRGPPEGLNDNMKSAAARICGSDFELNDFQVRLKSGTNTPNEYEAEIKFKCDATTDVMTRADSFNAKAFCAKAI
ncbi:MAG: hypothetical protein AAFN91_08245 [Pseudomonadota bacterium]|mgnify:FL=1